MHSRSDNRIKLCVPVLASHLLEPYICNHFRKSVNARDSKAFNLSRSCQELRVPSLVLTCSLIFASGRSLPRPSHLQKTLFLLQVDHYVSSFRALCSCSSNNRLMTLERIYSRLFDIRPFGGASCQAIDISETDLGVPNNIILPH